MSSYVMLDRLVRIGRVRAWWLMATGPSDACLTPLAGTLYDPVLRERVRAARRHARVVRRELRRAAPWTG